jgi:hypothetical protein
MNYCNDDNDEIDDFEDGADRRDGNEEDYHFHLHRSHDSQQSLIPVVDDLRDDFRDGNIVASRCRGHSVLHNEC